MQPIQFINYKNLDYSSVDNHPKLSEISKIQDENDHKSALERDRKRQRERERDREGDTETDREREREIRDSKNYPNILNKPR